MKLKHTKSKCSCGTCKLAKVITRIQKKSTPAEVKALNILWSRMEDAETEFQMLEAAVEQGLKVTAGGVSYVPEEGGAK